MAAALTQEDLLKDTSEKQTEHTSYPHCHMQSEVAVGTREPLLAHLSDLGGLEASLLPGLSASVLRCGKYTPPGACSGLLGTDALTPAKFFIPE